MFISQTLNIQAYNQLSFVDTKTLFDKMSKDQREIRAIVGIIERQAPDFVKQGDYDVTMNGEKRYTCIMFDTKKWEQVGTVTLSGKTYTIVDLKNKGTQKTYRFGVWNGPNAQKYSGTDKVEHEKSDSEEYEKLLTDISAKPKYKIAGKLLVCVKAENSSIEKIIKEKFKAMKSFDGQDNTLQIWNKKRRVRFGSIGIGDEFSSKKPSGKPTDNPVTSTEKPEPAIELPSQVPEEPEEDDDEVVKDVDNRQLPDDVDLRGNSSSNLNVDPISSSGSAFSKPAKKSLCARLAQIFKNFLARLRVILCCGKK